MKIQTGQGTISLLTLVGIWSISALNALPGLAVSPILGKLSVVFPHSSELDIQMLSSLPSLLIIPIIILSGKLTEKINNIWLLQTGLIVFALSGILYLFSTEMWQLIAVSALLGIGSGLIVPLSTGLISRFFVGRYRTKQFGFSSAITNVTLVLATTLTGYLAEVNWHLPFIVYLFPLVSLVLSFYLKENIASKPVPDLSEAKEAPKINPTGQTTGKTGIQVNNLIHLMLFYGLATYLVIIISFNLPFLMEEYHFTSGSSGIMISLFFLAIMAPGFVLDKIVARFKRNTKLYSLLSIALGMFFILISSSEWLIGLGCIFTGLGYGVIQPVIYDNTTQVATPKKVTLALAFVMAMNYLAILLCPFVITVFENIFHIHTQQFAFIFNLVITLLAATWAYVKRKSFLFNDGLTES